MRNKLIPPLLIILVIPSECFGFSAQTDCAGMVKLANHTLRIQATYTCFAAFMGMLMSLFLYKLVWKKLESRLRKAIYIFLVSFFFIIFIRSGLDIYYYSTIKPKVQLFGGRDNALGVQGFFSNYDKEWSCSPNEGYSDSYESVLEKWL